MPAAKPIEFPQALDAGSVQEFHEKLLKNLGAKKKNLSVDLSQVETVSTLALQLLVSVKKSCVERGGDLEIIEISQPVKDTIKLLGLEKEFEPKH